MHLIYTPGSKFTQNFDAMLIYDFSYMVTINAFLQYSIMYVGTI